MQRPTQADLLKTAAWFVLWLAGMDVAVTVAFPLPDDRTAQPNALEQYSSYGLSVEAKIRRVLGDSDEQAVPIALIGWPRTEKEKQSTNAQLDTSTLRIAAYGQSFTQHVIQELEPLMPQATFAFVGGPGAPLNFAYARYLEDQPTVQSDVAILGIVASSVSAIPTMTHMTRNFEMPFPYTYPRYVWNGSQCDVVQPIINSRQSLREALSDKTKRQAWLGQLRENDDYYSELMFRESVLDLSTCARLLRRAWGHHALRNHTKRTHGSTGFVEGSQAILSAKWMVRQFAERARSEGTLPVVLLFDSRDFADHLYWSLRPTLEADAIPYLSTQTLAPSDDPRSFLPDGHFVHAANRKFASALKMLIEQELSRAQPQELSRAQPQELSATSAPRYAESAID